MTQPLHAPHEHAQPAPHAAGVRPVRQFRTLPLRGLFLLLAGLLLSLPASPARAGEIAPGIKTGKNGMITVAGIRFELAHYAPGWKGTSQAGSLQDVQTQPDGSLTATMPVEGGALQMVQTVTPEKKRGSGFQLHYSLQSAAGVPTEIAALAIKIPVSGYAGQTVNIDGKEILLPVNFAEMQLGSSGAAKEIRLITPAGILLLRGDGMRCTLQDDRKFNNETYTLRLLLKGAERSGTLTAANLDVALALQQPRFAPLDLRAAANMSFRDETADDRKGGWTDQGANDLRMLPTGRQTMGGVAFDILAPEANNDKSCLAFRGPSRDYFIEEAALTLPAKTEGLGFLYLLHAAAWVPAKGETAGTVIAEYADGSRSETPLLAKVDVANWWGPQKLEKATVAWQGENPESVVGLYLSCIPLQNKPLKGISLRGSGKAVWMVAGATLSDTRIPEPQDVPLQIGEGREWKPLPQAQPVEPGSIMDFSSLHEAPAGKYGPLVVKKNGHFACAQRPEVRVKLIGANLCFEANFLEKEAADRLAQQWRMLGYNSVRLHHYDRILVGGRDATRSDQIDPKALDRFDYMFAAMKKAGMYVTIDLYTIRSFAAGEIAGWEKPAFREIKPLLPILPGAFEAWSKMSLQLLNHVNPYTGIAWKDDPAFFSICPVNEDGIFATWTTYPEVKALYLQKFEEWLKKDGRTPANAEEREKLLAQFLIEVKVASNKELAAFFKKNGVNALITGSNFISKQAQTFMREEFDFVDNHQYWDHPSFPVRDWQLPHGYRQRSATAFFAETPRGMMASRIFGKPFTVTEFNYTPPNQYRAEGGALMGAYAALQDWDGLYRFAWSHNDKNIIEYRPVSGFDAATDPLSLLTERQIVLLFARGDARPATKRYVYAVGLEEATATGGQSGFPDRFSKAGLVEQIGSQAVGPGRPLRGAFDGVVAATDPGEAIRGGTPYLPADQLPGREETILSGTGQTELDRKAGSLKVVTPKTECLVLPKGVSLGGKVLSAKNPDAFCSISASAMDGAELKDSKKILLLHLSNVLNTGMRFGNQNMTLLENWGKLPLLVRAAQAEVSLATTQPGLKVWALTLSGKRVRPVPAEYRDGALHLRLNTTPEGSEPVLAYEIAAE